jgi:hypothetical protein
VAVRWLSRVVCLTAALVAGSAQAQPAGAAGDSQQDTEENAEEDAEWVLSAGLSGYFLPSDEDYGSPVLAFDWRWLHVEARYNYEDQQTGSIFAGYNLSVGDDVTFDFTPMLGGVFGRSNGLAPGFIATLSFWRIELYAESEYLIDFAVLEDSFFYTWSEATLAPLDFVWFGFVAQRTRAYATSRDVQRGFVIGLGYAGFEMTFNVFDPAVDATVVLAVAAEF